MFSALAMPLTSDYVANKPVPAIYRRAEAMDIPRLPSIGELGTGGLNTSDYYQNKSGYRSVQVVQHELVPTVSIQPPFASLMERIQVGFGRTMSSLPEIFGVSRQTLYNWLSGAKAPKEQHHAKLYELAAAAEVFHKAGFKPNSSNLNRTVASGKSLVELIREGSSGKDAANRLLKIVTRGYDSKAKLNDILGDRKPSRLSVSEMGAPFLDGDS